MQFFKNYRFQFVIFLLLSMMFCKPGEDVLLSSALDKKALDLFFTDLYKTHPLPGLSVGIVSDRGSYFTSLGYGDLKKQRIITDTTRFFMGKFSELLVATAILKLQEDEILSVGDKIASHLPYFRTQGAFYQIKIHHLLTHTSGIPHFNPAWDMPSFEDDALEATTRSIVYQNLEFAPGRKRLHSPYNYDIAADLLAKAGNASFENIMENSVLQPLGMSRSTYRVSALSEEQYAMPYQIDDWLAYSLKPMEIYPYTRENAGSFGLHATTPDMMMWMKMVLKTGNKRSEILSDYSISELLKEQYKLQEKIYTGYGWEIIKTEDQTIYNNQWNAGGFSGDMSLFPDKGIGIIVVANTAGDFNPTVVSEQIARFLEGDELRKVKLPAHVAMSRKLAQGQGLHEVIHWYDSLTHIQDPPYQLSPSILSQLGINLLHRLDRKEDALTLFRYCVKKYPDSAEAHLNLTEGLLRVGCIPEAGEQFKLALNLNPHANMPLVSLIREQLTVAQEAPL